MKSIIPSSNVASLAFAAFAKVADKITVTASDSKAVQVLVTTIGGTTVALFVTDAIKDLAGEAINVYAEGKAMEHGYDRKATEHGASVTKSDAA